MSVNSFAVDERVVVNKRLGHVRYIGEPPFAPGVWVGIELDQPAGKNNGSVQGKSYFTCKDKHGVFVKVDQVHKAPESSKTSLKSGSSASAKSGADKAGADSKSGADKKTVPPGKTSAKDAKPSSSSSVRDASVSNARDDAKATESFTAGTKKNMDSDLLPMATQSGATPGPIDGEKMRRKYDELKKIAHQYKVQNEELKRATYLLKTTVESEKRKYDELSKIVKESEELGGDKGKESMLDTFDRMQAELDLAKLENDLLQMQNEELQMRMEDVQLMEEETNANMKEYKNAIQTMFRDEVVRREKQIQNLKSDKSAEQVEDSYKVKLELMQQSLDAYESTVRADEESLESYKEMYSLQEEELHFCNERMKDLEDAIKEMNLKLVQAHEVNAQYKEKLGFLESKMAYVEMSKKKKKATGVIENGDSNMQSLRPLGAYLMKTHGKIFQKQLDLFLNCFPPELKKTVPSACLIFSLIQEIARILGKYIFELPEVYHCVPIFKLQIQIQLLWSTISDILFKLESKIESGATKIDPKTGEIDISSVKTDSVTGKNFLQILDTTRDQMDTAAEELGAMEDFVENFIVILESSQPVITDELTFQMNAISAKFGALAKYLQEKMGDSDNKSAIVEKMSAKKRSIGKMDLDSPIIQVAAYCQIGLVKDPDLGAMFNVNQIVWRKTLKLAERLIRYAIPPPPVGNLNQEASEEMKSNTKKGLNNLLRNIAAAELRVFSNDKAESGKLEENFNAIYDSLCDLEITLLGGPESSDKSATEKSSEKPVDPASAVATSEGGADGVTPPGVEEADHDNINGTMPGQSSAVQLKKSAEPGKPKTISKTILLGPMSETPMVRTLAQMEEWNFTSIGWESLATRHVASEFKRISKLQPLVDKQKEDIQTLQNNRKELIQETNKMRYYYLGIEQKYAAIKTKSELVDSLTAEINILRQQSKHFTASLNLYERDIQSKTKLLEIAEQKRDISRKHYTELRDAVEERRRKDGILADAGVGNTTEVSSLKRLCMKYRRELYYAQTNMYLKNQDNHGVIHDGVVHHHGQSDDEKIVEKVESGTEENDQKNLQKENPGDSLLNALEKNTSKLSNLQRRFQELQKNLIVERAKTQLVDLANVGAFQKTHHQSLEHENVEKLRVAAVDIYQEMIRLTGGITKSGSTGELTEETKVQAANTVTGSDREPSMIVSLKSKRGIKTRGNNIKLCVDPTQLADLKKMII